MKNSRLRIALTVGFGAFVYAVLGTIGSQIDQHGEIFPAGCLSAFPVWLAACALALTLAVGFVPRHLSAGRSARLREGAGQEPPIGRAGVFLILMACWMPMFLIEFPGSFMYDTQRQTFQIATGQYDAFHPLLHTLALRLCLSFYPLFQSIEKSAALYSVCQMAILAGCFAETCRTLYRVWPSGRAFVLAVLFYALYPAHMAMACNFIKDVPFAGFFSLLVAAWLERALCGRSDFAGTARLIACGGLVCLLRNNMIYALAAWGAVLLFTRRRAWAVPVFLSVVLALCVNEGMIRSLNAARGSAVEMLSVPVQQLARARLKAPEAFSDADRDLMDSAFRKKGWTLYEPSLSDPVKSDIREDVLKARSAEFFDLWLRVGRQEPKVYADAFFSLILPSVYPYSHYRVAQPYIETGLQPGVLTAPFGQPPMTQPSRFEAARKWLDEAVYSTGADGIPLLRLMMNTGLVFWVLFLCLLVVAAYGGTALGVLLLPLLLYGTYLLGPVMQGRYLYPFLCVLPHFFLCAADAIRERAGRT